MILESIQQIASLTLDHLYFSLKLFLLLFGLTYDKDTIEGSIDFWVIMQVVISLATA